jgi:hypothetical protein
MKHPIAVVAVVFAFGALLFGLAFPTYALRDRLTINVEVDGQIRTGSSVIEARWESWPQSLSMLFGGGFGNCRPYGNVPLVDLGSRGVLLVSHWPVQQTPPDRAVDTCSLPIRAFSPGPLPPSGYPLTRWSLVKLSFFSGRTQLTANNLPQFVWLPDRNDPGSAMPVLASSFPLIIGPNVRLQSASLETTNEPLSADLVKKLPWLGPLHAEQTKQIQLVPRDGFLLVTFSILGMG